MIGFTLTTHGFTGTIDAEAGTPDGKLLVRLTAEDGEQRWFMAEDIA